jgi:hypothetical protein
MDAMERTKIPRALAAPMAENPYVELTTAFNQGRLRAVLSSGQAVVMHRLAIMSKDGDWILREEDETMEHVLSVLAERGARYRLGAPLDRRWLAGGWSAHLEHRVDRMRLRTDFVSRPPRLSAIELARIWRDAAGDDLPVVGLEPLAKLKKTNREKDYAVIGELARQMKEAHLQLLYSRSARDLLRLAPAHRDLVEDLAGQRPVLLRVGDGRDALEEALDAERRVLMRANESRLLIYREAMQAWTEGWPGLAAEIAECPLMEAHAIVVARAEGVLPWAPLAKTGEPS